MINPAAVTCLLSIFAWGDFFKIVDAVNIRGAAINDDHSDLRQLNLFPSSSCGKCVADDYATPCSAPTDCPTALTPGTCSAPSPQPTNGNECTQNSECLPNSGKRRKRGRCKGGGSITNTECDATLPCPTLPVRVLALFRALDM